MAYGIIKIDTITFTDDGIDKSVAISGLVQNPTFTGNVTATGTISGDILRGQTISGVTVTGTTAQFTSGTFTSLTGVTVTGTTANFTSGNFTNISGGTHTITSGVFASGTAADPSISFVSDPNSGLYSPGADQVAISTSGTGRLIVGSTGTVNIVGAGTAGVTQAVSFNGSAPVNSLVMLSDGKVGLGTSSPSYPASIVYSNVAGGIAETGLYLKNSQTGNSTQIQLDGNRNWSLLAAGSFGAPAGGFNIVDNTAGNTRFTIDSSGNVGIGTTDPNAPLCVNGLPPQAGIISAVAASGGRSLALSDNINCSLYVTHLAGGALLGTDSGNAIRFATNGFGSSDEKARIDSSGRLLVGTSSERTLFTDYTPQLQNEGTTNSASSVSFVNNSNGSAGPTLFFGKSRGTTVGSNTVVQADDELGVIAFNGADGTDIQSIGAIIKANVDGTPGSNDLPTRLTFSVTADGASSPTERMRISNAGTTTLTSAASTAPFIANIGASEAARIDSSGRLLVGTSNNRTGAALQIEGTTFGTSLGTITNNSANSAPAYFQLIKSRGTSLGSQALVSNGDGLGNVQFVGTDGTQQLVAAAIEGIVDGTPGANDMPGRLVFSTTADGASSPTERMRISANGSIFTGGATSTASIESGAQPGKVFKYGTHEASSGATITTQAFHLSFANPNGFVGSISTSGSATAYNTSSDYRLKENVVPLTGAVDRLNQLQVHRFNFIADPDKTVDGFIAHEAQAVVPECVTGTKDEVDNDGNPVYQGIDQSKIVPLVVAALQEALAEIETLKARLAEAGIS